MKAIEIGRVSKPHGLAGEVRVRLHWRDGRALFEAESLSVRRDGGFDVELAIESVRGSPDGPIVKLAGIDDRDAAEALRGARVCVQASALPPLGPGEYYLSDLVGATVVGPDGVVGEVIGVLTHPSVDSALIRLRDGSTAEQPLADPWVELVDLEARRLVLSSVEALIREQ